MENLIRLENLEPGDTFECPALEGQMKSGVVIRVTKCSVLVEKFVKKEDSGGWRADRDYCTCSLPVIRTGKCNLITDEVGMVTVDRPKLTKDKEIAPVIPKKPLSALIKESEELLGAKKEIAPIQKKYVKSVGDLPEGDFSIQMICEMSGRPKPEIQILFKNLLENKQIKFVESRSVGRGRPSYFYSKV
jgi:hypothetical protein